MNLNLAVIAGKVTETLNSSELLVDVGERHPVAVTMTLDTQGFNSTSELIGEHVWIAGRLETSPVERPYLNYLIATQIVVRSEPAPQAELTPINLSRPD